MQQRNRCFWKDPLIFLGEESLKSQRNCATGIFEGYLWFIEGLKSDATAERKFLKRPPHFFLRKAFFKWTQLRNRQFPKDPLKIQEGLVAYATAELMFLKRPPQFFWEKSLPKVNATAQQAFLKGTSDFKEGLKFDATAEGMCLKRPPSFFFWELSSQSGCNCATGSFRRTLWISK